MAFIISFSFTILILSICQKVDKNTIINKPDSKVKDEDVLPPPPIKTKL